MKPRAILVATAAVASLLLAACSSSNAATNPPAGSAGASASGVAAPAGLIHAGTLTSCIDPEYPPMEYFSNGTSGQIVGFDADGARALGKYWGLNVNLVNTAFDGLMPALGAKRCDIVWSALYLSAKRQAVADGVAYMGTGPAIITASGNPKNVTDAMSLCGLTVAAQTGSANEQIVQAQSQTCQKSGKPAISIQSYPQTAQTVAAVTNGKADALIETDVAVADMVSKSGGKLQEIRGVFPASTQFAIYVNKGNGMAAPLQSAISALAADGTLAKIATQYGLDPNKLVK